MSVMNKFPVKLHQLRYLAMVAEAGSIREAARRLARSQSAVSQSLNELEAVIGTRLLERRSHSVIPTAAGTALLKRVGVIEAELRYAHEEIRLIDGSMIGDLTVGISPAATSQILPEAIMNLKRKRPNVNLRLQQALYPDFIEIVLTGKIDFFAGVVPDIEELKKVSGLDVDIITSERMLPVVRREHPLVGIKDLTYRELAKWEWISFGSPEDHSRFFRDHFLKERLPIPQSTIATDSHNMVRAFVERGDYIAFLSERSLSSSQMNTNLVGLSVDGPLPAWNFAIVKRRNNLLTPLARMLIGHIEKVAREGREDMTES